MGLIRVQASKGWCTRLISSWRNQSIPLISLAGNPETAPPPAGWASVLGILSLETGTGLRGQLQPPQPSAGHGQEEATGLGRRSWAGGEGSPGPPTGKASRWGRETGSRGPSGSCPLAAVTLAKSLYLSLLARSRGPESDFDAGWGHQQSWTERCRQRDMQRQRERHAETERDRDRVRWGGDATINRWQEEGVLTHRLHCMTTGRVTIWSAGWGHTCCPPDLRPTEPSFQPGWPPGRKKDARCEQRWEGRRPNEGRARTAPPARKSGKRL